MARVAQNRDRVRLRIGPARERAVSQLALGSARGAGSWTMAACGRPRTKPLHANSGLSPRHPLLAIHLGKQLPCYVHEHLRIDVRTHRRRELRLFFEVRWI